MATIAYEGHKKEAAASHEWDAASGCAVRQGTSVFGGKFDPHHLHDDIASWRFGDNDIAFRRAQQRSPDRAFATDRMRPGRCRRGCATEAVRLRLASTRCALLAN